MSDDTTKRSRFGISTPDLRRLLGLPEDVEITEVKRIGSLDAVEIEVRGPSLPELDVWQEPRITPIEVIDDGNEVYASFDTSLTTPEEKS